MSQKPCNGTGQLQLIFGPMFSGKSSELIRRIRRYKLCNLKCLIIRYANDIRYSDTDVATHDGRTFPAVNAVALQDVADVVSEYSVIGIDEGQFFPDIVDFCKTQLDAGKTVIIAGLDGTYQRQGFGHILELVPLAQTVDKLSAICMSCGGKASFTRRIVEEKEVEVIGGMDKYMSVCRRCFLLESPKKTTPFKDYNSPEAVRDVCHVKKDLFRAAKV